MRFVIQRVNHASVAIDGETIGSVKKGYLVLIGISQTDTEEIADKMIQKMIRPGSFLMKMTKSILP